MTAVSAMKAQKDELRYQMRARRQCLSAVEVQSASDAAALRLGSVTAYTNADRVALYAPVRGELDTLPLLNDLRARHKTALYPRMDDAGRLLSFHVVTDASQLHPNRLGIPEPVPSQPILSADRIDVFVVPGLAFDSQGQRLGWGRGYYDTTLGAAPWALRVGYSYEFQIVAAVPSTADDEHMDLLCTPARIIVTDARSHPQSRRKR